MTHRRAAVLIPTTVLVLCGVLVLWGSCAMFASEEGEEGEEGERIPSPMREFRAAWVATVANIDWPSKPGLPVATQKREALAILDRLVALNMNAVVFQVRPQADALYASDLEPWSYYLTGEQGKPPDPPYDPLEFWIEAAHARGLQLHAWFNPYRANHPGNRGGLSDQSVVNTHPELVVQLGDKGYYWMDPSLERVQDHCVAVVLDVVERYDVDGVHFDDYFYPYPSYNDNEDFPDDRSFASYRASGGAISRNDWRRAAVDTLIARLYREIKATKPHVEFGISPFGIWRPGHPPGIRGLDQYDVLYADAKKWWNEGWVDYLTPQLYWPIARIPQSFPVLLGWWNRENSRRRHLWPGTTLRGARGADGATELLNQIMITRGMTPQSPGICMFSVRGLLAGRRGDLGEKLVAGPYSAPALIPASRWIDARTPRSPEVSVQTNDAGLEVSWTPQGTEPAFLWVVYFMRGERWFHRILPGDQRRFSLPMSAEKSAPVSRVAVSAVDRCRNESRKASLAIPAIPAGTEQ